MASSSPSSAPPNEGNSEDSNRVLVRRVVKKKADAVVEPINWSNILPGALKTTAAGAFAGFGVFRWRGQGPLLFAYTGFYAALSSASYLYFREVIRTERIPDADSVPVANVGLVGGAFSGATVGLMIPGDVKNPKVKLQRLSFLALFGAVLGAIGAVGHSYYLDWTALMAKRERENRERREQRFREDKERLGDAAYEIHRRDVKSSMPSWWPIRAVDDDEYEKLLDKQAKALERKRIQKEIEERERKTLRPPGDPQK